MRKAIAVAVGVLLLSACAEGPSEEGAIEGEPAGEVATPTPAAPTVADFAGSWSGTATLPGSDPVPSVITVMPNGTGTLLLTDRDPIPALFSVSGDSLVTNSAPYESVLRPGVTVSIRTATVRNGASMTGTLVATYRTGTGEEVVPGTFEATLAP